MNLIALAVPFFLLAIILELIVNYVRKAGVYRSNDAINSISAGILDTTTGYFTKFLPIIGFSFVMENFRIIDMQLAWFDSSMQGIALWIVAALAWDFCYYWSHRFGHEISILWAAHAVHHQSEEYNLSTALRQPSMSFLFNWIFYLPLFAIGFPLEVVLTVGAINLLYQFWVHTRLIGRLGPLEAVLMTPSHHRVHHAQNQKYIDKNYGGIFIIWDRLFGTFECEDDEEPVIYGVRKPLASWNPFWANLQVYDYLLFDAVRAKRWRDKIGVWFRRTGWRPPDVEAAYPKPKANLDSFRKFDPIVSAEMKRYTTAQFALAIALVMWIGVEYANAGGQGQAVLLPCIGLWLQLFSLGMLNEGRPWSRNFEAIRLVAVTPPMLLVYHLQHEALTNVAWGAAVVYVLASLEWLYRASRAEQKLVKTISN